MVTEAPAAFLVLVLVDLRSFFSSSNNGDFGLPGNIFFFDQTLR